MKPWQASAEDSAGGITPTLLWQIYGETEMPEKKTIELRDIGRQQRVEVDARTKSVVIPIVLSGESLYGQLKFSPTNLLTDDGVEIWTPSSWPMTH